MRVYSIHVPPPYSGRRRDPEVLREGFNWGAFLFTGAWALWHRMWAIAIVLIALGFLIGGGAAWAGLDDSVTIILALAVAFWAGFEANDWLRDHLARRGWRPAAIIAAPNADAALRRYADLRPLA